MNDKIKIAAVVVTYNRIELLKQCIDSLRNQSHTLDEIIIINNSSTDGTIEWLETQYDLTVITQENSGSAGGQYTGIKTAYEKGYDWIWCIDTDIILQHNALENLVKCDPFALASTGFLTSTILFIDGNLAHPNIPELANSYELLNSFTSGKPIPILSASFGALLVRRDVVKQTGFPCKDFFIWGDDAEFTLRIIKNGYKGFMIADSKAVHECGENNPKPYLKLKTNDPKFRYGVKNMVYVAILRNQIIYDSKIRGCLSGLAFIFGLYRDQREDTHSISLKYLLECFQLYISGIIFHPKIVKPD